MHCLCCFIWLGTCLSGPSQKSFFPEEDKKRSVNVLKKCPLIKRGVLLREVKNAVIYLAGTMAKFPVRYLYKNKPKGWFMWYVSKDLRLLVGKTKRSG